MFGSNCYACHDGQGWPPGGGVALEVLMPGRAAHQVRQGGNCFGGGQCWPWCVSWVRLVLRGSPGAGSMVWATLVHSDRKWHSPALGQQDGRRVKGKWCLLVLSSPKKVPPDPCSSGTHPTINRWISLLYDLGTFQAPALPWDLMQVSSVNEPFKRSLDFPHPFS